ILRWVPYSGFIDGWESLRFLVLPVVVSIISGMGAQSRFYRTLFLEEAGKDYVRNARAKGLPERLVFLRHILRNDMLPILTRTVSAMPLLFMGSLISDCFFGSPGLGSYTIDVIHGPDYAVVRAMVFLGAALDLVGLILADFST